jgi:hypothetical protein
MPPTAGGAVPAREGRGWCDDSFGVFCMLFNAIKGGSDSGKAYFYIWIV